MRGGGFWGVRDFRDPMEEVEVELEVGCVEAWIRIWGGR